MRETKFKKSEVGLIPEDWNAVPLSTIGEVKMCKRIFKDQTAMTGDVPFYKIGTFGAEPDAYISRELYEDYRAKFAFPEKGDILLSASGTIGRIVEYNGEDGPDMQARLVWCFGGYSEVVYTDR